MLPAVGFRAPGQSCRWKRQGLEEGAHFSAPFFHLLLLFHVEEALNVAERWGNGDSASRFQTNSSDPHLEVSASVYPPLQWAGRPCSLRERKTVKRIPD